MPLQNAGISLTPSKTLAALFIPLLLIIPGVAGLQVSLWTTRRRNSFSQLERLVLSALISLGSLFVLYAGGSVFLWELIDFNSISNFSLFQVVCGYILHFATAAVVGVLAGTFVYNYYLGNSPGSMYDSWGYLFNRRDEGDKVLVRTSSGLWLEGHVHQVREDGESRDLLLSGVDVHSSLEDQPATQQLEPNRSSNSTSDEDIEINEDDPFDKIDEEMDEEFKRDYGLMDSNATEQLQFLHLEESEIEAVGQEKSVTEGFDEEVSAKDRLQRRTGSIASTFGYKAMERWLVTQFNRANSERGRVLSSITLILGLWATLTFPAMIGELTGVPPTFITALVSISTFTLGYTEFLRYDLSFAMPRLNSVIWTLLLGVVLAVGSLVLIFIWPQSPTRLLIGGLVAGSLASVPVSLVISQIRYRYTETVSLTVTVVILACIGIAVPIAGGYVLPRAYGQSLILFGVSGGVALFVERIRVGQPGPFEEWPRVLADILAIALAASGAVLIVCAVAGFLKIISVSWWGTIFTAVGAVVCILLTVRYRLHTSGR